MKNGKPEQDRAIPSARAAAVTLTTAREAKALKIWRARLLNESTSRQLVDEVTNDSAIRHFDDKDHDTYKATT